jgi:hypothetical protein
VVEDISSGKEQRALEQLIEAIMIKIPDELMVTGAGLANFVFLEFKESCEGCFLY